MMEVLRGATSNAQFALQPWDNEPHPWHYFNLPANTPVITIVTNWGISEHNKLILVNAVFLGDYSLETLPPTPWAGKAYEVWEAENHGFGYLIPEVTATSCMRFHINLWLMHGGVIGGKPGQGPRDGRAHSVTVTRFQYTPKVG